MRAHWAALLLALATALLCAAPQLMFRFEHRADGIYQGIELLPDNSWPPRVREIMDGHGFGDIYYAEGKSNPYLFQPLGSWIVGQAGLLFGLDINDTLLLARIILPAAVVLLIYLFTYALSRNKYAALSAASVLVLSESLLSIAGARQLLGGPVDFLNIDLPLNPAMILLPAFAFLAVFYRYYETRDWRWGAASSALLGLNFYIYFYSWTYLFSVWGFVFLIHLLRREWKDVQGLLAIFGGALLVAIPYGINIYRASQYPAFESVGLRQGILYTHAPEFVGLTVVAALLVYLFAYRDRIGTRPYFFGLALLLAPFVTLNQQILTGRIMQEGHYHWYFHKPLAVLLMIVVLFLFLSRLKSAWLPKGVAALIVVGSVAFGAYAQAWAYRYGSEGGSVAIARQAYGPVMDWFNARAEKDEVLLANNNISYMASIYTPLNFFYHRAGMYALTATHERQLDQLLMFWRLRGVTASEAPEVFRAERRAISVNLYGIHYRQLLGSYESIPDEKIDEVVAAYNETLKVPASLWLQNILKKYNVRWLVWDPQEDPEWSVSYPFLVKEAQIGRFSIYKVAL